MSISVSMKGDCGRFYIPLKFVDSIALRFAGSIVFLRRSKKEYLLDGVPGLSEVEEKEFHESAFSIGSKYLFKMVYS